MMKIFFLVALIGGAVHALDNGIGRTPPMGWLSWERFRCNLDCKSEPDNCISEKLYTDMADRLHADGFLKAGYEYVNVDDCWANMTRDADGNLQADAVRFPHGMKWLGDYIHSKGLKFGIYSDIGVTTCAGFPATGGHFEADAKKFAEWGVDSLKVDGCNFEGNYKDAYISLGKALNATGRPILYACSWPAYGEMAKQKVDYEAAAQHCNLWRNFDDIQDSWDSVKSILEFYGTDHSHFLKWNGPGHFNDPDMLILGDFGLSHSQEEVQMGMWSMLSAPLLMSNDLRRLRWSSKKLLLNRHLIAINQDPLGSSAILINAPLFNDDEKLNFLSRIQPSHGASTAKGIYVWLKKLSGSGRYAFAIYNLRDSDGTSYRAKTTLAKLTIPAGKYHITDVFSGSRVNTVKTSDTLILPVSPSGIVMYLCESTN